MELYGSTVFAIYLLVAFITLLGLGASVQHAFRQVGQPVAFGESSQPQKSDEPKAMTFSILFYTVVALGILGSAVNLAAALIAPH